MERAGFGVALPVLAYLALREIALAGVSAVHRPLGAPTRVLTFLEATGRYVGMTVDALRPRTSVGKIGAISPGFVLLGGASLSLGIAVVLVRRRRQRPPLPFGVFVGVAFAALTLAPVLQLVPLSLGGAVAADRLLYLPLAGLTLALAVASRSLARVPWRIALGGILGLLIAFASTTYARCLDYHDELGFWLVAAEGAHPRNPTPRNALAALVRDAGATELACRLFRASMTIQREDGDIEGPAYRRTRENHAACVSKLGRYDEALAEYLALVAEHPEVGRIHTGLAYVRMVEMDFDAARDEFARATQLDPRLVPLVRQPARALERARSLAVVYRTPEAQRADPLGYADFLASIGRIPDAESALLSIAVAPTSTRALRTNAVDRLSRLGGSGALSLALEASPDIPAAVRAAATAGLEDRARVLARVAELRGRIELLASR
jgi:tetratricopeptide (TPR) repeat protein